MFFVASWAVLSGQKRAEYMNERPDPMFLRKTNVRHLARGGQVRDSRGQLGRYEIGHLQQS